MTSRSTSTRGNGSRPLLVVAAVMSVAALHIGASAVGTAGAPHALIPAPVLHLTAARQHAPPPEPIDPSFFAPGACVAYPPTTVVARHRTVFLDAGHGGIDPGATGVTESVRQVFEADLTLAVELDATALLRAAGFRVVVSRTRNSNVIRLTPADVDGGVLSVQGVRDDVAARDVCANLAKANVLVGIYFDAGSSPQNAGCLTAYDADRPFSAQNLRLATLVQWNVLSELNARGADIPNDGVVSDVGLGGPALSPVDAAYGHLLLLGPANPGYFNTPSEMPGALIEPLYVTDPFEATIAASRAGQEEIAMGIARAVEEDLGTGPSHRLRSPGGSFRRPARHG